MGNTDFSINNNIWNNFKSQTSVSSVPAKNKPVLNKLINDFNTVSKQQKETKTPLIIKLITHPSLLFSVASVYLTAEMFLISDLIRIKNKFNKNLISKEEFLKHKTQLPIKFLFLFGFSTVLGVLAYKLADKYNNGKKEKYLNNANKIVENFNREEKSDIKISVNPINSGIVAAVADPFSGKIVLGEQFYNDFIYANFYQKPFLKHELTHMKQFILISRSENGISKLNFLITKKLANALTPQAKKEISQAYQEISAGADEYYKNFTFDRLDYKVNLADYITALYKVIYEKNLTENDIPIIINKEFYDKIRQNKGELSALEKQKANEYIEAYEKYPQKIGLLNAYNPFSEYRQNLMEKEAYKSNPWYAK